MTARGRVRESTTNYPCHVRPDASCGSAPIVRVTARRRDRMTNGHRAMLAAHRRPAPPATIPDVDVAGSVLTGRNVAFEVRVVERMVLNLHGEPAFAWPFARAFGDRPALQHTVELQTK